jgi:hypothetical protein
MALINKEMQPRHKNAGNQRYRQTNARASYQSYKYELNRLAKTIIWEPLLHDICGQNLNIFENSASLPKLNRVK